MDETFERKEGAVVPKVYELVQERATLDTLAYQAKKDFAGGDESGAEKAYIGLEEIMRRDKEGLVVLRELGSRKDALGAAAAAAAENPLMDSKKIETILGIRRWGEVVDIEHLPDDEKKRKT